MKVTESSFHLTKAVEEILTELGAEVSADGLLLHCHNDPDHEGLTVTKTGDTVEITYQQQVLLFRGLSIVKEHDGEESYSISQKCVFESNGTMIDCSRNAVLKVRTVKKLIRQFALMGCNMMMLYTEDTYEVKNQPYYGYMRGRYSTEELKELDAYAKLFGIELVPCIQTLAHLQCVVRWAEYRPINDVADILLTDDERTYRLIEDMISSCRDAFSSSQIHIGMDEAWMLGRGKFQDIHGYEDRFEIMCRHLERVIEICKKYNFTPMMWSDMFFHLIGTQDEDSGYGSESMDSEAAYEKLKRVPKGVTLVYWDYYAKSKERYDHIMDQHLKFNDHIIFAGGAWRWSGYAPTNHHSIKVSRLALQSCLEHGVTKVFSTAWGDNGADASIFSALPSLLLFAECGFNPHITDEELASRFKACFGAEIDDFLLMDQLNGPEGKLPLQQASNPCKYLLFQDPMMGIFDRHAKMDFGAFYGKIAKALFEAEKRNPDYAVQFRTLAQLASVLEYKSIVGLQLKDAYDKNDRAALKKLANEILPRIASRASALKETLEEQWIQENKAFGFEVQDIRISGVISRAHSASRRINAYLNGEVDKLEELACDRLFFDGRKKAEDCDMLGTQCNLWHQICTGTVMAGI